jgi:hypothetical protein
MFPKTLDYFSRKKRLKENNFGETPKLETPVF